MSVTVFPRDKFSAIGIYCISSQDVSERFVLISSSYLCLGHKRSLSRSGFQQFCMQFRFLPAFFKFRWSHPWQCNCSGNFDKINISSVLCSQTLSVHVPLFFVIISSISARHTHRLTIDSYIQRVLCFHIPAFLSDKDLHINTYLFHV